MRMRMSPVLWAVLVLLAALPFGQNLLAQDLTYTTGSTEAREHFMRGLENSEFFLFNEAREDFQRAVVADPKFAMAYYYLSTLALTAPQAQEYLARAVELSAAITEPERLIISSARAANENNAARARADLEKMVSLVPGSKRAHFALGTYYYGIQEMALAEKELQSAVGIDSNYAPPYNMLAYLYTGQDNYQDAIAALQKYARIRPADANPLDSMGEIYLWGGDHDNSLKAFGQALTLDPNFLPSYAGIGHNYVFMGKFDDARASYDQIASHARTQADTNTALFWTFVSYLHENKPDKAIKALNTQEVFARNHDNKLIEALVVGQYGRVYCLEGEFDKALMATTHERAIASDPKMSSANREFILRDCITTEALVNARQGKIDKARSKAADFMKSAEASGIQANIDAYHALLGVIHYWNKDYKAAIDELEQANSQDQEAKYYCGLSYEQTGNKDEASRLFSEVVKFNRNSYNYALVRPLAMTKLKS